MEENSIPFTDSIDCDILMHKNAHFGKSFDVMLDYYNNDGVGVQNDFDFDRIEYLKSQEEKLQIDLFDELLLPAAKAAVEDAINMYEELKKLYEENSHEIPLLIANLILSEEEDPIEEKSSLIQLGEKALPALHTLLETPQLHDPLFPGYGLAPQRAVEILKAIGDMTSIPPLFAALRFQQFSLDEAIIEALLKMQHHAKPFLLKKLEGRPLCKDNEYAAMILSNFADLEVAKRALLQLKDEAVLKKETLSSYLICILEHLDPVNKKEEITSFLKTTQLTDDQKEEINLILTLS